MREFKPIPFVIALAFAVVYAISNLGVPMRNIMDRRSSMSPGFWSERVRYGDLYSFSNLTEFKSEVGMDRNALHPHPLSTLPRDIDLYAICDSYLTENFVRTNQLFSRVDRYLQVNLYLDKPAVVTLDPRKTNVLLIEKTEREVVDMLTARMDLLLHKITVGKDSIAKPTANAGSYESRFQKLGDALFNPHCNDNLQTLFLDYQVFTGLREVKARLNSRLFGRISPEVVVAGDRRHLLYEKTVDPDSSGVSSFAPLTPGLVDTLVKNLNIAGSFYRRQGFDTVLLSIIPNSATVLEKQDPRYNRLIPLIYSHPSLKVPVVDVFELFRDTPTDIIAPGDSHWNSVGFYMWLDRLNAELEGLPVQRLTH